MAADAWKLQFPGLTESLNRRDYRSSDRESASGALVAVHVAVHLHTGNRCLLTATSAGRNGLAHSRVERDVGGIGTL